MSGGHFNYAQHHLTDIADEIENVIAQNDSAEKDKWGDPIGRGYDAEVISEFRRGVRALRIAEVYAQRIDWLLSGDDGEDSFKRRLLEEMAKLA